MPGLHHLKTAAITAAMILFLSSYQAYATASAGTAKTVKMGDEVNLLLNKRKVDPIKAGKRAIRVLVNYNATNYFIVKGKQAGLEYELMHSFENYLNKGLSSDKKYHLIFITLPFDQLIPALVQGEGDIIAAGMTITPERSKKIAFSNPYRSNISEVIVRNKEAHDLNNAKQLSGRTVHIVKGSSYFTHLKKLNAQLEKESKAPTKIIEADESLVSEDLLQMVNAGIYQYTVVDSHIANIWSRVLEDIVAEDAASISKGGQIAWAVRKGEKDILNKLNLFLKNYKQGTKAGNILFNRYYKNTKWISNPVSDSSLKRLHQYQK